MEHINKCLSIKLSTLSDSFLNIFGRCCKPKPTFWFDCLDMYYPRLLRLKYFPFLYHNVYSIVWGFLYVYLNLSNIWKKYVKLYILTPDVVLNLFLSFIFFIISFIYYLFIHLFIIYYFLFILFIYSFIYLLLLSFIYLFIYLFSIYLFIYSFIYCDAYSCIFVRLSFWPWFI